MQEEAKSHEIFTGMEEADFEKALEHRKSTSNRYYK